MNAIHARDDLKIFYVGTSQKLDNVCLITGYTTPEEEAALRKIRELRREADKLKKLYATLSGLLSAELERQKLKTQIARLRDLSTIWHQRLKTATDNKYFQLGHGF